jgi:hypothetical protein
MLRRLLTTSVLLLVMLIGFGCKEYIVFEEMPMEARMISPAHNSRLCATKPTFTWEVIYPLNSCDYYELYVNGSLVTKIPTEAAVDGIISYTVGDEFLYSPSPYTWTVIGKNEFQQFKHYGDTDLNGDNPEAWHFYIADCEPPRVNIIVPEDESILKLPQEVNGVSSDNVGVTLLNVYVDRYTFPHHIDEEGIDRGYETVTQNPECTTFPQWFPEAYCVNLNPDIEPSYVYNTGGGYTYTVTQDFVEELGLEPGRHTITAQACDAAGNCSETSHSVIIVPPLVEWPEDAPGIVMIPSSAWGGKFGPGGETSEDSETPGPWFNPVTGTWGWGPWGWGWGLGGAWGLSGWFPWGWGGFGGFSYGDTDGWMWDGQMIPEDAYSCDTDTPSFSWHEMDEADTYEFQLTDIENVIFDANYVPDPTTSPDGPGIFINETNLTSTYYTVSSPLPEYAYIYRARGVRADGTFTDWSDMMLAAVADLEAPILLNPPDEWTAADTNPVFTWTQVFGASGYELIIGTEVDSDGNITPDSVAHAVTVSETEYYFSEGLDVYTDEYYWQVRAIIGDACQGDWSETREMTIPMVDIPQLISDACSEPSECRQSWADNAYGYKDCTDYVAEKDAAEEPLATNYCETQCQGPSNCDLCDRTNYRHCSVPQFQWNDVPGVIAYHWRLSKDPSFPPDTGIEEQGMDMQTAWTPGGAYGRGDYYFQVRSVAAMRYSPWSEPCHFFLAGLADGGSQTSLTLEPAEAQDDLNDCDPMLNFTWTPVTYDQSGTSKDAYYYLEVYSGATTSGGVIQGSQITDGSTSLAIAAGLLEPTGGAASGPTTITWRVRVNDEDCPPLGRDNPDGAGTWSTEQVYNYYEIGTNPSNFTISPPLVSDETCDRYPTFSWNASNRTSNYVFQISTDGTFGGGACDCPPNTSGTHSEPRKDTGCSFTGCSASVFTTTVAGTPIDLASVSGTWQMNDAGHTGTDYSWRVRAENAYCVSDWVTHPTDGTFTFIDLADPTTMNSPTGNELCDRTLDFSWDPVPNASGYKFQLIEDAGTYTSDAEVGTPPWDTSGTAVNLTILSTGPNPGNSGLYKWRIAPYNNTCPDAYEWTAWEDVDLAFIDPVADIGTDDCDDPDGTGNWGKADGRSHSGALVYSAQPEFTWGAANGHDHFILQVSDTAQTNAQFDAVTWTDSCDIQGGGTCGLGVTGEFQVLLDPTETSFDLSTQGVSLPNDNGGIYYWRIIAKDTGTGCESPASDMNPKMVNVMNLSIVQEATDDGDPDTFETKDTTSETCPLSAGNYQLRWAPPADGTPTGYQVRLAANPIKLTSSGDIDTNGNNVIVQVNTVGTTYNVDFGDLDAGRDYFWMVRAYYEYTRGGTCGVSTYYGNWFASTVNPDTGLPYPPPAENKIGNKIYIVPDSEPEVDVSGDQFACDISTPFPVLMTWTAQGYDGPANCGGGSNATCGDKFEWGISMSTSTTVAPDINFTGYDSQGTEVDSGTISDGGAKQISYTINAGDEGHWFTWRVRSVDDFCDPSNESPWIYEQWRFTPLDPPAINIAASDIDGFECPTPYNCDGETGSAFVVGKTTNINIAWDPVPLADAYEIMISEESTGQDIVLQVDEIDTTTFNYPGDRNNYGTCKTQNAVVDGCNGDALNPAAYYWVLIVAYQENPDGSVACSSDPVQYVFTP